MKTHIPSNLTPAEFEFAQQHASRAMISLMTMGEATDYVKAARSAWASALALLSVDPEQVADEMNEHYSKVTT